jgi:hypothetical protein
MKKLLLVVFSFVLVYSCSFSTASASIKMSSSVEPTTVELMNADKYWFEVSYPTVNTPPAFRFHSITLQGQQYRGYLSYIGTNSSIDFYQGYVYRAPLPYPIPY